MHTTEVRGGGRRQGQEVANIHSGKNTPTTNGTRPHHHHHHNNHHHHHREIINMSPSSSLTPTSVQIGLGIGVGLNECAGCGKRITDRFLLKALDMLWHEDCLKCGCCDCRLGEVGSTLYTKANLILCKRDYLRLFGNTGYCAACSKVIPAFEMVMRARNNVYHLECFACQQCSHRFCVGDKFYLCENKILCEYDYQEVMVFANMTSSTSNNSNPMNNSLAQIRSLDSRVNNSNNKREGGSGGNAHHQHPLLHHHHGGGGGSDNHTNGAVMTNGISHCLSPKLQSISPSSSTSSAASNSNTNSHNPHHCSPMMQKIPV